MPHLPTVKPSASSSVDEEALERRLAGALAPNRVRMDGYTRGIYSTDASMYAIRPLGVVYPGDAGEVAAVVEVARDFGVSLVPRGAGTSLCGQTVGPGLVLDLSRFMTEVLELDPERRRARVQPGVVQEDLDRMAAGHGLLFAPDTATANRATVGGMIGNNSCGTRSAAYGMTIDHVEEVEVILSDGSRARFSELGPEDVARRARAEGLQGEIYRRLPELLEEGAETIRAATPPHWRRSGGYRLERLLPEAGPWNLAHLVVGSEGTLAVVTEATVRLVPRPREVWALVACFETLDGALRATPGALEAGAAAVELLDRTILDLARRSASHGVVASGLQGDPGAVLWVEFHGLEEGEGAAAGRTLVERWGAGGDPYAVVPHPTAGDQARFQEIRKAGLGLLLSAGEGGEEPLAFIEDAAVAPEDLAEYGTRLRELLVGHGLRAGFYGHASGGCIHVRPCMDLTRAGEPARMREVAQEVMELVRSFGGMNSSEHGDGLVRSEFNPTFFGQDYYRLMRRTKEIFDPEGLLNPGKKVEAPLMTEHLRTLSLPDPEPVETHFAFPEGMRSAANRCGRIGACRKSPAAGGTMCPSYMATRNEEDSTRGRANALADALSRPNPAEALGDARLHQVLDLCLECKACQTECPLSVDMAALKSEALAQRHRLHGTPFRSLLFGHIRELNRFGSAWAPLSNLPGAFPPLRILMERTLGIHRRRPLPRFRRDTLQSWFQRRRRRRGRTGGTSTDSERGRILLLADCFTSFTEPEVGRAAVELLEAAGWKVGLAEGLCCGRSLISKGLLPDARRRHRELLARLTPLAREGVPIVGCEPSCILTLKDEVPALARGSGSAEEADQARVVAEAARLVDEVLAEALDDGGLTVPEVGREGGAGPLLFHGHCHQEAARAQEGSIRVLEAVAGPGGGGNGVEILDAGCCGMAGSFGFEVEHYELSMTIGSQRLFPAVESAGPSARVAATGVSCRQQIAHGTGRKAEHPVVLLREAVGERVREG